MYNPTPAGEAFQVNGVWYQDYNVDNGYGQIVVKRYMHDGTQWVEAPTNNDGGNTTRKKIDLLKHVPETAAGINLKKSTINLDKCLINLEKSSGVNMTGHTARVATIMDYSGSMRPMYKDGAVQQCLNRLASLALRFDDNGELDVWLFHGGYRRLESMDISNFENYVDEVMMGCGERFGATSYAPVLRDVKCKYVDEEPSKYPAFVIFVTDGSNDDKRPTDDIIRELSHHNVFVQFVGIGYDSFSYLRKLDDLKGRPVDNTGFISVADINRLSDEELYSKLLEQYIPWLKAMHIG